MKLDYVGFREERAQSVTESFNSFSESIAPFWKREIYPNAVLIVVNSVYRQSQQLKILKKKHRHELYVQYLILESSGEENTQDILLQIMTSYVFLLLDHDRLVREIISTTYQEYFNTPLTADDDYFTICQCFGLWFFQHPGIMGKEVQDFCEDCDRQLRGCYVPTVAHGLWVS